MGTSRQPNGPLRWAASCIGIYRMPNCSRSDPGRNTPARSLARLIPLRVKEGIHKFAGRPVFDLSFYLQFQPNSVLVGETVIEPLVYYPKAAQRRKRIALVTPHLGPGGAEAVLYDIASTLCSSRFESLLLATQSRDDHWLTKWRQQVDHVYDLARVVTPERMVAALCSIISNWQCDYVLIQNSLYGYAAIPHHQEDAPGHQDHRRDPLRG